ncbi:AAA family ATPase [Yimella radicis]
MASLFYLVGPPAVGKLTVARCLEQRTGAIVVDNHLINDPVFVPMGVHRGEGIETTNELRGRVLDIVHEAIRLAPTRFSHVLTHWLPDKPKNAELVERVRASAAARQARFVPVWLTADVETLAGRVTEPDRSQRAKLVDAEILRQLAAVPNLPPPPDALVIDSTSLTADEVADRIVQHVERRDR